jgi:hypothetical protein
VISYHFLWSLSSSRWHIIVQRVSQFLQYVNVVKIAGSSVILSVERI